VFLFMFQPATMPAPIIWSEGFGVEHIRPKFPALLECGVSGLAGDGIYVVFDGGRFGLCLVAGREGDPVGGFDGAAAVDEFGVDRAGLGGADGQGEAGAGVAVGGGEGFVSDEESVADGEALFGENSGERGDGAA
jgi:hypothetical protein